MKSLKMVQKHETIFVLTSQDVKKASEGFEKEIGDVQKPTLDVPEL